MDIEVNYIAVLLAGISSMVVGMIWYAPSVFGNSWMSLAGIKRAEIERNRKSAPWGYLYVFIASLVTAYILAHVTVLSQSYFDNDFMTAALSTAFWLWLGFTATRIFTHDLFEMRRKQLTLLTITHELVTVLVMALIIGAFGAK